MRYLNSSDIATLRSCFNTINNFRDHVEGMAEIYKTSRDKHHGDIRFVGVDDNGLLFEEIDDSYDGYYISDFHLSHDFVLNFEEWHKVLIISEEARLKKEIEENLKKEAIKKAKAEVNAKIKKDKLLGQLDNLYAKYPGLKQQGT